MKWSTMTTLEAKKYESADLVLRTFLIFFCLNCYHFYLTLLYSYQSIFVKNNE